MSEFWLEDNPPVRDQFRARRGQLRYIVLHTPESSSLQGLMDFIRNRTSPGSYHSISHPTGVQDMIDPVKYEAYGVKYGYNRDGIQLTLLGYARHFAVANWREIQSRWSIVRNAIQKCASWCVLHGIEPVLRTRAEIDEGKSGITTHARLELVPGRRSDPGLSDIDLEWFCEEVRKAMNLPEDKSIPPVGNIIGMTPGLGGYYIYTDRGAVYAFGAKHYGSLTEMKLHTPIVDMVAVHEGYYLLAEGGGVFAMGRAKYLGNLLEFLQGTGRMAKAILAYWHDPGYAVLDSTGQMHFFGDSIKNKGDMQQGVL